MSDVELGSEREFQVRLVSATEQLLTAASIGPDELAAVLGVAVPTGWPTVPEVIPVTLEFLSLFPAQMSWAMYFFIHDRVQTLVGSGGFKGEPVDGSVEIWYEIAPGWRDLGAARAAVSLLLDLALSAELVTTVTAETLADENASVAVLRALGFNRVHPFSDAEHGEVWQWERSVP